MTPPLTREIVSTWPPFAINDSGWLKEAVLSLLADRDDWKRRAAAAKVERDEKWRTAENMRADMQTLTAARDAARAEVERLREALRAAAIVLEAKEQHLAASDAWAALAEHAPIPPILLYAPVESGVAVLTPPTAPTDGECGACGGRGFVQEFDSQGTCTLDMRCRKCAGGRAK